MRAEDMAKGVRAVMSITEVKAIETALIEQLAPFPPAERELSPLFNILVALRSARERCEARRSARRMREQEVKRRAQQRALEQIHRSVDGYNVIARMGDWIDMADHPDRRLWVNARVAGEDRQAEIKRDAWCVVVCNPDLGSDNVTVGTDISPSGAVSDIDETARRIIARENPPT
jgi:hypothetical protein